MCTGRPSKVTRLRSAMLREQREELGEGARGRGARAGRAPRTESISRSKWLALTASPPGRFDGRVEGGLERALAVGVDKDPAHRETAAEPLKAVVNGVADMLGGGKRVAAAAGLGQGDHGRPRCGRTSRAPRGSHNPTLDPRGRGRRLGRRRAPVPGPAAPLLRRCATRPTRDFGRRAWFPAPRGPWDRPRGPLPTNLVRLTLGDRRYYHDPSRFGETASGARDRRRRSTESVRSRRPWRFQRWWG